MPSNQSAQSLPMKIFGVLNITEDSFSDGGIYLSPDAAIEHGIALTNDGADVVDIGAASSKPGAKPVEPGLEIARLAAVLQPLRSRGIPISIDSFSPLVQDWALDQGVEYLNDIHGFSDPLIYSKLAASSARLIVMHALQGSGVATHQEFPPTEIFGRAVEFFAARTSALLRAGISRDRLILDPGMGFFVGVNPENSLILLRRLPQLKQMFHLPILISVSRKSFLGTLIDRNQREPSEPHLLAATLVTELFAACNGADYIRTHAPGPLKAAAIMWSLLRAHPCV